MLNLRTKRICVESSHKEMPVTSDLTIGRSKSMELLSVSPRNVDEKNTVCSHISISFACEQPVLPGIGLQCDIMSYVLHIDAV